jgi:hypothetical protein
VDLGGRFRLGILVLHLQLRRVVPAHSHDISQVMIMHTHWQNLVREAGEDTTRWSTTLLSKIDVTATRAKQTETRVS